MSGNIAKTQAFGQVFDEHAPTIYRYVARRVGAQAAEDVTADVFCSAYAGAATFDPGRGTPIAWLMGITTNALANHWRREQRYLSAIAEVGIDPLRTDAVPSAERGASATVETQAVARVLTELPDGEREALMLYAWADLGYGDIAAALGIPIGTVRSRIARARQRLRDELQNTTGDHRNEETLNG